MDNRNLFYQFLLTSSWFNLFLLLFFIRFPFVVICFISLSHVILSFGFIILRRTQFSRIVIEKSMLWRMTHPYSQCQHVYSFLLLLLLRNTKYFQVIFLLCFSLFTVCLIEGSTFNYTEDHSYFNLKFSGFLYQFNVLK